MSSAAVVSPVGSSPRVEYVPSWVSSQADDAAFLSSAYGLTPDDWQFRVLEAWLAEGRSGRWAAARCGLAVPRQNGKNALLEVRELYGMVELGERFLHTAHEVKTARKAFARLAGFFENRQKWPELAGLVESIRKTNGQEAIVLRNGGSVEFVARSRGSGRGYTVDVLVMDEAQELTDEQLEALLPTISSAPSGNPQTILTGTPPPPGTAGEVFTRTRQSALDADDPRLAWHEWSVDGDVDLSDRTVWAATNPALGTRLHPEVVESELAQMSEDGFARERLGSWAKLLSASIIDPDVWHRLADPQSEVGTRVAFAVDMPPNRSFTSIAVAGPREDGLTHIELVDHRKGTAWVAERLIELVGKWDGPVALDPGSPAGSLIPELQTAGIEPVLVSGRELAQACGSFYDATVERGTVRHLGQPKLNVAVDAGRKRTVGDAWAWHRKDASSDISPLVAVTLAHHVCQKPSKRKPRTGRAMFV
jgi:hypothetical protein